MFRVPGGATLRSPRAGGSRLVSESLPRSRGEGGSTGISSVWGGASCGRDGGRMLGDVPVLEDGPHGAGVGEEGEDAHLPVAAGTPERVDLVDPGEELGPATVRAGVGLVAAGGTGDAGGPVGLWVAPSGIRPLTPVAGGLCSPPGVGGEDSVLAVPVDARRRDQARQTVAAIDDFIERLDEKTMVHPAFGRLTRGEWGRWAFRHMDHHSRQFGV